MPIKRICFFLIVFLLSAGAVKAENTSHDKTNEKLYRIPVGNRWETNKYWVLDHDGNEVPEENQPTYDETILLDLETDEDRYIVRSRNEVTRNENDYPMYERWSALFDMAGNKIIDWEKEVHYSRAFGDYVVRLDTSGGDYTLDGQFIDENNFLYHVPTRTKQYKGTYNVMSLDNGNFLVVDHMNTTMGIIDRNGNKLDGFPMDKPYYDAYTWNRFIIASEVNRYVITNPSQMNPFRDSSRHLMDSDFNVLLSGEWISPYYGTVFNEYIGYSDKTVEGIFHPEDGIIFTVEGESIEYFDGTVAILGKRNVNGYIRTYRMVTLDGKELANDFTWFSQDRYSIEAETNTPFMGIRDNKVILLNQDGSVIAASESIDNLSFVYKLWDGLFVCYGNTNGIDTKVLLNADLKTLIPMGRYSWVIDKLPGLWEFEGQIDTSDMLLWGYGRVNTEGNEQAAVNRWDIIDINGNVIIGNVTEVYDAGPDRIALRRGFSVGLMDWNGNWIVRRSIFTNEMDD